MSLAPSRLKDSSIREAYEDAGSQINAKEMANIIRAALDKKRISPQEKRDLKKILLHGNLTDKAREKVNEFLSRDIKYLRGNARKRVVETIYGSGNVKRICFRDPINGLHYEPRHFEQIASLVSSDDIDVWEYTVSDEYEGKKPLGYYVSSDDNLFISKGRHANNTQRNSTIVHEATHAIQDKTNVQLTRWDAEAAAHIAQAIMLLTLKPDGSELYNRLAKPAIRQAAEKVLEKKAITALTEKDWKKTYKALKKAYPTNDKVKFDNEWYSFFEKLAFHLST
jgi:hypothetical protein